MMIMMTMMMVMMPFDIDYLFLESHSLGSRLGDHCDCLGCVGRLYCDHDDKADADYAGVDYDDAGVESDDLNDYDDANIDDDDDNVDYDVGVDLMIIAVALAVHGNRIMMRTMVLMILMITDQLDDDSMMTA